MATITQKRLDSSERPEQLRTVLMVAVAFATGLLSWEIIVWISDGWVPSLTKVGAALVQDIVSVHVWEGALISFVGSTVLGLGLGFLMGLLKSFDAFWRPLIVVGLAIPDPVYFLVAILVLGTEESTALLALILAVAPFVVTIVVGAVDSRDKRLDDMSQVYRISTATYLTQVLGRQLVPGLLAAARTAFAFSWKVVVLMEALTQPDGIGAQIYYMFRLLRPAHMIALALIFIVVMRAVEWIAFTPLERRLLRWRA